jgi:SAM-dependent methyltransferase
MDDPVNTSEFWEACYETQMDNWDIGGPTPVFERLSTEISTGVMCVIGCGRGYDAVTFAKAGFEVTAIDFARTAVLSTREKAREENTDMTVLREDIFDLPEELYGKFDYVLEYTCFCAINPIRRFEYDRVIWQLLKPGGKLLGLFFPLDKEVSEGGPPWGVDISELHKLFNLHWDLEIEEMPKESIEPRADREVLMVWKKK